MPNGGIVEQPLNLVALEGIGQGLVEAGFQVNKPPSRVVLSQLRFALAAHGDIDQFNREAAVAQMKAEIMAHPNRIDPHNGQAAAELIEKIDHLPAGVGSTPRAHANDPAPVVFALADVDDGLRFPGSYVDSSNERPCAVVG